MRWRFTSGRLIFGIAQVLAATALAFNGLIVIAATGWAVSLYACGRRYTGSRK